MTDNFMGGRDQDFSEDEVKMTGNLGRRGFYSKIERNDTPELLSLDPIWFLVFEYF